MSSRPAGCTPGSHFDLYGDNKSTIVEHISINGREVPKYTDEYWTPRQRQGSSIHEVSYRACFKPQLPAFFIKRVTGLGDTVYDPFSGRGTTVLEAGRMGREVISNDVNPLSEIITRPRFFVPEVSEVSARLGDIRFTKKIDPDIDLTMFFHPDTMGEILSLKSYLGGRKATGAEDDVDRWIRMVATNRLTGHSPGFFSVYTLPPNQAVSPGAQVKINKARGQRPEYRDVKGLILKKTWSLLRNVTKKDAENLRRAGGKALFLNNNALDTPEVESGSVRLTVTSPPFLDVVQYAKDNWLRCWLNGIDAAGVEKSITMSKSVEGWSKVMADAFREFYRITAEGGWVAFEVGEVRKGTIKLDEHVVPLGLNAGFSCEGILINLQKFTKTANIWGVDNNTKGTNTNRIVLFRKGWN